MIHYFTRFAGSADRQTNFTAALGEPLPVFERRSTNDWPGAADRASRYFPSGARSSFFIISGCLTV